jgi:hypothetical protein
MTFEVLPKFGIGVEVKENGVLVDVGDVKRAVQVDFSGRKERVRNILYQSDGTFSVTYTA